MTILGVEECVRVAAVHAAPVLLDRDASIRKLETRTREAAGMGAQLVVFGESFVPGFPVWNLVYAPIDQHGFFRRLFHNAVTVPGNDTERLGMIARTYGVILSVGVTEKSPTSLGTMWNTNLIFDEHGELISRHRKLIPTWAEKLSWANGDASQLSVNWTNVGGLGALICGENFNTLARFALLAQGEQIHISTYPPIWPVRRQRGDGGYDLTDAIRIRSAAHSIEGKVYNIVASCSLDDDAVETISEGDSSLKDLLADAPKAVSMIVGPTGEYVAKPVQEEAVLVGDLDLTKIVDQRELHDITGHYNRFDIFRLEVDKRSNRGLRWVEDGDGERDEGCRRPDKESVPPSSNEGFSDLPSMRAFE